MFEMNSIGKRIRFIRKANNLTLTDINKKTGLSTGNLSELENDKFLPSANALIQFRKIFNTSIDWILTGEEYNTDLNSKIREQKQKYISEQYTDEEKQLIKIYRKLDGSAKQNIWGYLNVITSSDNK
jgi:transcriptional regulator with XRE-family HTH domain